ncbi:hypothetical protein [Paenibacillus illinoisensis]|uniref:hypothetical protein n=1 Tax=Paenibacillus illinoisensis TaxID=59845 RepID=UPI00301D7FCE
MEKIKKIKKLVSKPSPKENHKNSCGCKKDKKKIINKTPNSKNRVPVTRTTTIPTRTIIKKLNTTKCRKKIKNLGTKRAILTYNQSTGPVSGGGDGFEIDSLGDVFGPDVRLGQLRISQDLYTSRRARINAYTICDIIRTYSCLRGTSSRRFCTLESIRSVRCNWTRTGTIFISAEITIPLIYTDIVNSNSNILSCITDNTGVMRDYILNHIGPIDQLSNTFLINNLSRIQTEAVLEYQDQLVSCLSSYMDSTSARALANGLRVAARVRFFSLTDWVKTS